MAWNLEVYSITPSSFFLKVYITVQEGNQGARKGVELCAFFWNNCNWTVVHLITNRRELFPFGVKVSIIEPGAFATPILEEVIKSFTAAWSRVPSEAREAYGQPYFEEYYRLLQELLRQGSSNLRLVTDKMEHALTSCHPYTLYSSGWDAKLFYLPVSYLPTSLADYVLTRSFPKPVQAV